MTLLNAQQQEAVSHKEGPVLVLAGAGAGKTRVITERIATLIRDGVDPEHILAVTFTNKAAKEMKERIAKTLGNDPTLSPYDQLREKRGEAPRSTPFVGTFHAISLHIIKTFHQEVGLPARFNIFDRSDSLKVIKKAIQDSGFDPKELEPSRVLSIMGKHKGNAVDVTEFREVYAGNYIDEAVAEVWERYKAVLLKEKALDFDDILLTAYHLLTKNKQAREHFMPLWKCIHVDEYQDTNRVQYEIIRTLASHGNIMAVGDADQNIYTWRGASLKHIMDFEKDFPGSKTILLTQNYRSTQNILTAANDAIAKNVYRKEKVLTTTNQSGEPLFVAGLVSENAEAQFVVRACRNRMNDGYKAEDIAVLYRANFQSRVLEEAFLSSGIAYQVLGTRFFERKEIKDALAYIKLAENPDSTTDLSRALNTPTRGLGKVALAKILGNQVDTLSPSQKKTYERFQHSIERIREKINTVRCSDAIAFMLSESGLRASYENKPGGDDEEKLMNLKELVSVAGKYDALPVDEGIQKLLEDAALQSDQDELPTKREDRPGVKLMTIHAAKGLEFPVVFITGLEEGLFPYERESSAIEDTEEERRLFYVALTRAEQCAYLTYACSRTIFGTRCLNTPSEFITELDKGLIEQVASPGYQTYDELDEIIS